MRPICTLFVLAFFVLLTSCNRKKALRINDREAIYVPVVNDTTAMAQITPLDSLITKPIKEEVVFNVPRPQLPDVPQIVLTIGKTACYGDCPVFFVKLYSNGEIEYTGIKHVAKMGNYRAKIQKEEVKELLKTIKEGGYFDLANEYPCQGTRLVDLPNTITYFHDFNKSKTITNNYDAPKELLIIEQFILRYLEGLDYAKK